MEEFDLIFSEGFDPVEGLGNAELGSSNDPFSSGFDSEHPMPSYEQLRNAGFSHHVADNIVYGTSHSYSQKELFHVLYESDNPLDAYNDMMKEKADALNESTDALIKEINESGLLGSAETSGLDNNTSYYNETESSTAPSDNEDELGSCDCRSECKYNTGETYKYANYGYSD